MDKEEEWMDDINIEEEDSIAVGCNYIWWSY